MRTVIRLAILLLFAATATAQTAGTVTFTAQATTGNGSVTPVLTWSTAPAATSCTAGGSWSGTKAAAGTETLPAIATNATYTITCTWPDTAALVSWTPPTKNTDGSDYTTPKLTRILYGRTAASLTQTQDVNEPATSYQFTGLASGAWFFGVKAVNQADRESALSNVASKVLGTATASRSVGITVNALPLPPTGVTVQ
jgi:hypothetical protein